MTGTDKTMTMEEFNQKMIDWTSRVRSKALARLDAATSGGESKKGRRSLRSSLKYDFGEVYSTGFKFAYYLVFIHYGVGHGYIRQNGMVIRGRSDRYKNAFKKQRQNYAKDTRPIARHGFDWLDIEIRSGFDKFADIVQEYHGDKAANEVFKQSTKLLIDKQ